MSKYDNPVRGYIHCPVCQLESTVHQVGEGQLMATGEPPKNSRNLGILYYRCPDCGTSSMSKKTSAFIEANIKAAKEELQVDEVTERQPLPTLPLLVESNNDLTENKPTLTDTVTETLKDSAENGTVVTEEVTEPATEEKPKGYFTFKRVLALLGAVIFLIWMVNQLIPKPSTEKVTNHA